jgi:hypothetical protein
VALSGGARSFRDGVYRSGRSKDFTHAILALKGSHLKTAAPRFDGVGETINPYDETAGTVFIKILR